MVTKVFDFAFDIQEYLFTPDLLHGKKLSFGNKKIAGKPAIFNYFAATGASDMSFNTTLLSTFNLILGATSSMMI